MPRAAFVICSRLRSSRVPEKAMRRAGGVSLLHHILRRIAPAVGIRKVMAVPEEEIRVYREHCSAFSGIEFFAGHAESPLHRMAAWASRNSEVDWIIRITNDDPLVDLETALGLLERCEAEGAGYGVTPRIVEGSGVEVIRRENVLAAAANRPEGTEFIGYFVRGAGLPFPKMVRMAPRPSVVRPYRLTVDYPEDLVVLDAVLRAVGPDASLDRVAEWLDSNPEILGYNTLPELSVYTCARNAEGIIGAAMFSAAMVSSCRIEHVVVDDFSSDGTLIRLATESGNLGTRLLVNESNLGLAASSNRAVAACRGRFVMRLDADDRLLVPNFGSHFPEIRAVLDSGFVAVYPSYYEEVGGRVIRRAVCPARSWHAGGAVFDRAFLNEVRFREGIRHWDGLELKRLIEKLGGRVATFPEPTWVYRVGAGSMSRSDPDGRLRALEDLGLEVPNHACDDSCPAVTAPAA